MRHTSTQPYIQWLHADGDEGEANKRIEALLRAVAPEEVGGARLALCKLRDPGRLPANLRADAQASGVLRHKLA